MTEKKAHAKFSASGSERWLNCPGSIRLESTCPETTNKWAEEGTTAHKYLEVWLKSYIKTNNIKLVPKALTENEDMYQAVKRAMREIRNNWDRESEEIEVESRVSLDYIHKGMFGTCDITVSDHYFRRLKITDYKHGRGEVVELVKRGHDGVTRINTQLAYYGLGAAKKFDFKFDEIELGIIQPRAKHVNGPFRTLTVSMKTLRQYEGLFKRGVERCLKPNAKVIKGNWCHWCRAKGNNCPEWEKAELEKTKNYFN